MRWQDSENPHEGALAQEPDTLGSSPGLGAVCLCENFTSPNLC